MKDMYEWRPIKWPAFEPTKQTYKTRQFTLESPRMKIRYLKMSSSDSTAS